MIPSDKQYLTASCFLRTGFGWTTCYDKQLALAALRYRARTLTPTLGQWIDQGFAFLEGVVSTVQVQTGMQMSQGWEHSENIEGHLGTTPIYSSGRESLNASRVPQTLDSCCLTHNAWISKVTIGLGGLVVDSDEGCQLTPPRFQSLVATLGPDQSGAAKALPRGRRARQPSVVRGLGVPGILRRSSKSTVGCQWVAETKGSCCEGKLLKLHTAAT